MTKIKCAIRFSGLKSDPDYASTPQASGAHWIRSRIASQITFVPSLFAHQAICFLGNRLAYSASQRCKPFLWTVLPSQYSCLRYYDLGRRPSPPCPSSAHPSGDVAKAFFSLFNQALIPVVAYPFLSDPTRCAMDTLKRSLHKCFFVYHSHSAHLADEVVFFETASWDHCALNASQLMTLRATYHPSFAFTLRCLPTLVQLHLMTAWTNSFPQKARPG